MPSSVRSGIFVATPPQIFPSPVGAASEYVAPDGALNYGAKFYKDVAPTALAKNGLVGGAGGVTVLAAMKTLSAKGKVSGLTLLDY